MTDDTEDQQPEYSPDAELPDKSDIIEAYIQYSEESRYRDGLMHNSYYFILIALVLFTGHLLSLNLHGPMKHTKISVTAMAGGAVLVGIGTVIKTYNRKKINAEDQRQVLENVLDDWFTESGIYEEYGSERFTTRESDNPFAIQSTVVRENKGLIERLFIEILPINWIATGIFWIGIVVGTLGIIVWFNPSVLPT